MIGTMRAFCVLFLYFTALAYGKITGITLTLNSVTVSPNDIITMDTLGSGESGLIARTTHTPCCAGTDGNWFLPAETQPLSTDPTLTFFQSKTGNGEVILNWNNIQANGGLFRVNIPNSFGTLVDVHVGIYPDNDGEPESVTIERQGNAFKCTSSGGPATNVVWRRNCQLLSTGTRTQSVDSTDNSVYESVLTLATVPDGDYSCTVENRRGRASATITVGASPFSVSITPSVSPPTAGQPLTLTCSSTSTADSFAWINAQDENISTESNLMFSQLRESQREFSCVVTVSGVQRCAQYYSSVQLPDYSVSLAGSIDVDFTSTLMLSCITTPNDLTVTSYNFYKGNTLLETSTRSMYTNTMSIGVANTGNDYRCVAMVMQDFLDLSSPLSLESNLATVTLTIPSFRPTLSIDSSPLYSGQDVSFSCGLSVNGISGITADITLFKDDVEVTGSARITAQGVMELFPDTFFSASYSYQPVSRIEDSGSYYCQATVSPEDTSLQQFVTNGVGSSIEQNVDIDDPELMMTISSVTERILDFSPYNSFTLTCTATLSAPSTNQQIPKTFQWSESGNTITAGVVSSDLSMGTSTSELSVTTTSARTYQYRCSSMLDLGNIPDSVQDSVTTTVVVHGPADPNLPSGVTVSRVDHQSATIQWTIASLSYDRESYRVSFGNISNDLQFTTETIQGNENIRIINQGYSVELTGLLPLTTYYYTLIATNGHNSVQTPLASFNTTGIGPGSPQELSYEARGGLEFEFSWLPPNDTGDVMLGQYSLTCMGSLRSVDSFQLPALVIPSNDTRVLGMLSPWANYTCFVVASNQDGVSPPSNTVSLSTQETAPSGVPQQFFLSPNPSRGVVRFTWNPPELTQQNGAITSYSLECVSALDTVSMILEPSPGNSYQASRFRAVTSYQCSVSAVNSAGQGPPATITITSGEDVPGAAPGSLSVQPNTTSALFTWLPPPASQHNGVLTGYTIFCYNSLETVSDDYGAGSTSGVLSGLTPARVYSCNVSASTAPGSGPSAQIQLTTVPMAPGGVVVQAVSSTQLRASWTVSQDDIITQFIIYVDGVESGRSSGSEFDITSLAPYTLYNVQVSAVNEGGESSLTGARIVRTLEDYPGIVNCNTRWVSSTQTSVTVSWSPPMMANGVTLGYNLSLSAHNTPNQVLATIAVDSATRTATLNTTDFILEEGVPFSIAIVAENSIGQSREACMAIDFTRQLTPPPPSNVVLSRPQPGDRITVTWSIPTLTQARGFLSYTINYQPSSPATNRRRQSTATECSSSLCVVPVDQGSVDIIGLDPGSGYDVTVTPANELGEEGEAVMSMADAVATGVDIAVIAGAAGGGVVLILIVVAAVLICCVCCAKRRVKKKGYTTQELELETGPTHPTYVAINPSGNTASPRRETLSPLRMTAKEFMEPIPLEYYPEFVKEMHKDRKKGFDRAFQVLPGDTNGTCTAAKRNKEKNKYQMFPYDSTRVKLSGESDYINASYIHGYSRKNMYIAAQGPMPTTKDDFWRMIWELKLSHVVVLTKCKENGKIRCERYWPMKAGEDFISANISITCTEVTPYADYEIRKLYVTDMNEGGKEGLVVNHYQFTGWPENVIPEYATSLIAFIRRVRGRYNPEDQAPLLVHCSEGVGRTGAFIVLDTILERMKEQSSVNIFETLHNIRLNRSHMVKTLDQFVFIHDAVNELVLCGDTAIAAADIRDKVKSLHKIRQGREVASEFKLQFELLDEVSPKEQCSQEALQHYNVHKNRYHGEVDKMPNANSMVYLKRDDSQGEGSEYINASFINGYKKKNAYIATQAPLQATTEDFWRMIWEQKIAAIVMLCNLIEEKQEASYLYWPDRVDCAQQYGRFWVTLMSEDQIDEGLIRRILTISGDKNTEPSERMSVTQFHYTGWPEADRPLGTGQVLMMLEELEKVQRATSNKTITVMCNDGIGRTGAFICIHCQWQKVKTEGTVDLFQFVKSARLHRMNLITELEHYIFCHDTIADYVDTFKESDYKNFS